jgi:hypothetical protein
MLLQEEKDPMSRFTYALKAPETRRQYPNRLKLFFDYLGIKGPIGEQAKEFLIRAKNDSQWAEDNLMAFI